MSNKSNGTKAENAVAADLRAAGYYVHLLNQNKSGQPADLVAIKKNIPFLLDVKDCKNEYFATSRVEDNQVYAMNKWRKTGNSFCGFVLRIQNRNYLIHYDEMMEYIKVGGKRIDLEKYKIDSMLPLHSGLVEWVRNENQYR